MGMRRGERPDWLKDDNDQVIGVSLSSSHCAEHEWGIKDLYRTLGVKHDENVLGIDRYCVNPNMEAVILIEESKNNAALIVEEPHWVKNLVGKKLNDMYNGVLYLSGDDELATAWDGKTFGIHVKRPTNIKKLKRIYNAIKDKDAAVWLGGGGPFQNAGLTVGIISVVPQNLKQQMYDAHVDQKKLAEASDKTGIKQKIDELNEKYREEHKGMYYAPPCGYYALSPSWIGGNRKSAYPVMYWLNPMQQDKNESGWYTVEDLLAWAEGRDNPVSKQ